MEDAQLHEFLDAVGQRFTPSIPDEVVSYFLETAGFSTDDPRIIRMVGLVAQKFVLDVGHDAKLYQQHRLNAHHHPHHKATLTMEDLSASLKEYGVNLSKPEYICDDPSILDNLETEEDESSTPVVAKK